MFRSTATPRFSISVAAEAGPFTNWLQSPRRARFTVWIRRKRLLLHPGRRTRRASSRDESKFSTVRLRTCRSPTRCLLSPPLSKLTSTGPTCGRIFHVDFAHQYVIVEVSAGLVDHAATLARRHALRGYDAVQLAAALQVHSQIPSLTLLSADADLNAAAVAEGLSVDDPNNHP